MALRPTSAARLHLLNQTTLQAWVWFGVTLIVLGYALARLEPTLAIALSLEGRPLPHALGWPALLGAVVVLGGSGVILLAGTEFLRREREIDRGRFDRHHHLVVLTVAGTAAVSLALALGLVLLRP